MKPTNSTKANRATLSFAAIDPYIQRNIVLPTESLSRSRDLVEWGDNNAYPDYLLELYNSVPTLRSIVNGNIDFICGDDSSILPLAGSTAMNRRGETIQEQLRKVAKDYEIYGGFALQVIRNMAGQVVEIYHLDMRFLRSNKENTVFYYSEEWNSRRSKVIVYPAFIRNLDWPHMSEEGRRQHSSSVLFVKAVNTQVYPAPVYAASVKACEIERCIDDYHLSAINNSFTGSVIINFNNGIPDDEIKEEIERSFNEKFSGHQNAGRMVFSWNRSKESETTITESKTEDFGDRYQALAKHSRQQIFTAFRANPNLFGIPTESLGFSSEEYESAFRLYNRTQIKPVQRIIADAYDRIYGQQGVLTIQPFSIEGTEQKVN